MTKRPLLGHHSSGLLQTIALGLRDRLVIPISLHQLVTPKALYPSLRLKLFLVSNQNGTTNFQHDFPCNCSFLFVHGQKPSTKQSNKIRAKMAETSILIMILTLCNKKLLNLSKVSCLHLVSVHRLVKKRKSGEARRARAVRKRSSNIAGFCLWWSFPVETDTDVHIGSKTCTP